VGADPGPGRPRAPRRAPSRSWFLSTMQAVLSRPRAGKPVSAVVQEAADPLAFAAEHTGLR